MHPDIKKFWEENDWIFTPTFYDKSHINWWADKKSSLDGYTLLAITRPNGTRYFLPDTWRQNDYDIHSGFSEEMMFSYMKMKAFW